MSTLYWQLVSSKRLYINSYISLLMCLILSCTKCVFILQDLVLNKWWLKFKHKMIDVELKLTNHMSWMSSIGWNIRWYRVQLSWTMWVELWISEPHLITWAEWISKPHLITWAEWIPKPHLITWAEWISNPHLVTWAEWISKPHLVTWAEWIPYILSFHYTNL